jgi:predicted NBD/HSP70 family sugar kinase
VNAATVGQPSLLRAINRRAVFELVAAEGPVAATRIVRGTGLSKPTVSEVLRQLHELGLVSKVGRTQGQVGPSAQLYDVDPKCGSVLAIDVGREWLRVVAADLAGKVIARADEHATRRSARHVVEQIDRLVTQVEGEAGSSTRRLAVLGTPGVLQPGDSHFALAPQLPGWEQPEIVTSLRERLACPVRFENDVNLAAIGELTRGAGRGVRDFVLVSIGTGLGMAVVLDGKLHRGASGLAGEIAYLPIGPVERATRGRRSTRWHVGPFERLVSSRAVVELAREAGLGDVASAAPVIDAARNGNAAARAVVATIAERLAQGIAAVAAVLDPELVMLGGGIGTGAGRLLLDPLQQSLEQISPLRPRFAISELGNTAILDGAVSEGLRDVMEDVFGPDARTAS